MLKSMAITNFHSIGEKQELSFEIKPKEALDDSARLHESEKYINTVSCIIGANASGKTNFIKALSFISWFVKDSYESLKVERSIPLELHKLKKDECCSIELEFYEKAILYRYSIELNKKQVLKEKLEKKVSEPRAKFSCVFELTRNGGEAKIKTPAFKMNKDDWERIKLRSNISLLSALLVLGYLPEITFFSKLRSNVSQSGRNDYIDFFGFSKNLSYNEQLQDELLSFSNEIDLGIKGFSFKEVTLRSSQNPEDEIKQKMLLCLHTSANGDFYLPIHEESEGTQKGYFVLYNVLPILKKGGTVFIDEIEGGLHPYVAKKIISLFENKETNPHNAQLVFSTHQHLLLNDRTKTQIFITEKNLNTLESEIYRLDDVEDVRNDENYFHKYMAGAYGGTPNIKWF
ncbi:MAG: AAA family ATPase [Rickettsiales bacterium]